MYVRNITKQYKVTYDSNYNMFFVHRKESGIPNMELRIYALVSHVYHPNDPNESNITFINTLSENMKEFTKRETNGENMARQLYSKMLYPSNMDFRWMIQNNNINKCDVVVRDIDIAQDIWGKDIDPLKGETARTIHNPVAGDTIKIPKELLNIKKTFFLTVDIFSVNKIPFLSHSAAKLTSKE